MTENEKQERLTNNEFRELIFHLEISEVFLTEILIDKEWRDIFTDTYKQRQLIDVACNVCKKNFTVLGNFRSHLKGSKHLKAVSQVKQFYHPVYTYPKNAVKLANGETVSEAELEKAINEAKEGLKKVSDFKFSEARSFASIVKTEDTGSSASKVDETKELINLALKTNATRGDLIYAEVSLPLLDLLKIEFCEKVGEWKKMLTTEHPHPNGKYFCALCSKYCAGIITVNAHLNGYSHKSLQVTTEAMRVIGYENLTKNCSFRFDNKHKITIKRDGRKSLKQLLEKSSGKSEESSKETDNGKTSASSSVDADKNGKAESEKEKEKDKENNKISKSLAESIEAKAKALAASIPNNTKNMSEQVNSEGLIGVEYVIQLMKTDNDPTPMYECCLCEVVLNEARMQGHLIAYNHRLKYCEMHYGDTIKKYKDEIGHVKYFVFFSTMGYILKKLAWAIEDHHGRSIPYSLAFDTFTRYRPEVVARLYALPHATQQQGPSFSNVLSKEEINQLKKVKEPYRPPTVPSHYSGRFTEVASTEKLYLGARRKHTKLWSEDRKERSDRRSRSKSPNEKPRRRDGRRRTRSRSRSRSRSHGHRAHADDREEYMPTTRDIWKIYREQISIAASKVENDYMEYRKNPENHPQYDKEWNKFWRRRKEELITQGIDHRAYNYQPEWVHYFRQRLELLFGEELHTSTINVRKLLNIPLDAEEDSKPASSSANERSHYIRQPSNPQQYAQSLEPLAKRICYSSENSSSEWNPQFKPMKMPYPEMFNEKVWGSVQNDKVTFGKPQEIPMIDDKPNVIHVLRIMTALEDHLGSLGNKVMELLSKALVLEKQYHNSPLELEQKVLTTSNCGLLETAMEKLKGILFAGLLDGNKVQGFNRVIESTTNLLKHAEKMGWRNNNSFDFAEKDEERETNDIQKLLKVMQNKKVESNQGDQKLLSDTLAELISMQKKATPDKSDMNNYKQFESNEMQRNSDNIAAFNRSSFSNSDSLNLNSNSINRYKQANEMNSLNQMNKVPGRINSSNQIGQLSSFSQINEMKQQMNQQLNRNSGNYNMKQNFRSTQNDFDLSNDNSLFMNRANNSNISHNNTNNNNKMMMFNDGSGGRNNLNNQNFNNNATTIDNGNSFGGNNSMLNSGQRSSNNYSQNSSNMMMRPNNNNFMNTYGSTATNLGAAIGNAGGNRGRFPNNNNNNINSNNQFLSQQQFQNRR